MKKIISFSMILTGFTAMASQIIYMRELLVVFYGNELSISFILAGWLVSGALGSAVFGRFVDLPSLRGHEVPEAIPGPEIASAASRPRNDVLAFSSCQIILAFLLIAGIAAVKFIKTFLGVNPGEIIGLFPIIVASFAILAPICMLMGFMFSLGCRIYSSQRNDPARGINHSGAGARNGNAIGNVYILEAIGSIVGGAITSFILIRSFDALHIMAIFAELNILAAFLLSRRLFVIARRPKADEAIPKKRLLRFARNDHIFRVATLLLFALIIALWGFGGLKAIERYSLEKQWPGYEILETKNSIYGNILMAKRGEDYTLFDNGLRLYTVPDKPNTEEAVHLALLEHVNPKRVLLIGGGVGGLIEEILKHNVEKVDYVELDPSIIEMSEKNLPEKYYNALKDARVSIKNADGRYFVKNSKELYDCIIVHTGDPYTAQGNRYYTSEFFSEAKRRLNPGGIISFGLASSESYISKPLAEFLKGIYATLSSVFNKVLIIPGETAYFLASDSPGALTYDHKILEERTLARKLDTQYVRDYYLFSKLSSEKISYCEKIIKNTQGAVINHDSRPAAYYYGLIFWTTLFRDSAFSRVLRSVTEPVIWSSIGLFVILLIGFSFIRGRSFKRAALTAVMAGGFSSLAFQMLILLTFQAMHGYLFYKLGVILTAFMAGLALGAVFTIKVIHNGSGRLNVRYYYDKVLLIAAQGDFIMFSAILGLVFSRFCPDSLFPVLSIIAGSIGGAQFVIANKVLLGQKDDAGAVGGLSYGMDLLGSFFGALLTGIFLIPILGTPKTCFAVALINIAVLVLLIINMRVEE